MPLRPRYSLLTLLILTALVAGGVKWWRGPHWRTLNDPLTIEDHALIAEHFLHSDFHLLLISTVNCKYFNSASGPELLLIHGQPTVDAPLIIDFAMWHEKGNPPSPGFMHYELAVLSGLKSEQAVPRPRESILCWYSPPFQQPSIAAPSSNSMYTIRPLRFPLCYFVTDQKRVYQSLSGKPFICVSEIKISEISNQELRTLIEQELSQISDPR